MTRILYIAYHFPPHGGAGVQRSLKFVKYLPSFGVEPTIVTGVGATDRRWSPPDESLENEVPQNLTVVRTPWPKGSPEQCKAAEDERFQLAVQLVTAPQLEAVFVSMSPFSDASFAARVARHCGIPWIADLRDPWALDEFQVYKTRWHRARARREMRRALSDASLIVMNTPESAKALKSAFPEFGSRTISITNGYDSEDLVGMDEAVRPDLFTLVHAGFLHTTAGLRQRRRALEYRLLGRIGGGVEILPRSHYYLLQALERWRTEDPSIADRVRLLLVGDPQPVDREIVERSPVAPMIEFTGYLPHNESLRLVREAALLFLPMHKLPKGQRATIVPGKTYEYLASGRSILGAVPEGDARDFLARAGTGLVCDPDDVEALLAHLRARFRTWSAGTSHGAVDRAYIRRFERKELASRLAEAIRSLCITAEEGKPAAGAHA